MFKPFFVWNTSEIVKLSQSINKFENTNSFGECTRNFLNKTEDENFNNSFSIFHYYSRHS